MLAEDQHLTKGGIDFLSYLIVLVMREEKGQGAAAFPQPLPKTPSHHHSNTL